MKLEVKRYPRHHKLAFPWCSLVLRAVLFQTSSQILQPSKSTYFACLIVEQFNCLFFCIEWESNKPLLIAWRKHIARLIARHRICVAQASHGKSKIVLGQFHGGVVHGIGGVLLEKLVYDGEGISWLRASCITTFQIQPTLQKSRSSIELPHLRAHWVIPKGSERVVQLRPMPQSLTRRTTHCPAPKK